MDNEVLWRMPQKWLNLCQSACSQSFRENSVIGDGPHLAIKQAVCLVHSIESFSVRWATSDCTIHHHLTAVIRPVNRRLLWVCARFCMEFVGNVLSHEWHGQTEEWKFCGVWIESRSENFLTKHWLTIRILEKFSSRSGVKSGVPSSMKDKSVRYIPRYGMHGGSQRCNASRIARNRPSEQTTAWSFWIVCLIWKSIENHIQCLAFDIQRIR